MVGGGAAFQLLGVTLTTGSGGGGGGGVDVNGQGCQIATRGVTFKGK